MSVWYATIQPCQCEHTGYGLCEREHINPYRNQLLYRLDHEVMNFLCLQAKFGPFCTPAAECVQAGTIHTDEVLHSLCMLLHHGLAASSSG